MRTYTPAQRRAASDRSMRHYRKKKYGLNPQDIDAMILAQGGYCGICNKLLDVRFGIRNADSAVVDHCHRTGKVRAILCHMCNVGLGTFRDSTAFLANAIDYLQL